MPRQHSAEGVELNVTAMLDMAFQLLAFFILTFRPGPFEPAVQLHLPPARPIVPGGGPGPDLVNLVAIQPAGIDTLRINLSSTGGRLDRMTINDFPSPTFAVLRTSVQTILANPASPIEQVVVQASAGPALRRSHESHRDLFGATAAENREVCEVETGGDGRWSRNPSVGRKIIFVSG